MIILDTHIWLWWVHEVKQLTRLQVEVISTHEADIIGISAISCWEVAKLVEYKRLNLPCSLTEWFQQALSYPGISLLELTPEIAIQSTQLLGKFHRDPVDQIVVATSMVFDCPLVTSDAKILNYPHIVTVG